MVIVSNNDRPIELEASICIADTLMILCYYKQFQYTRRPGDDSVTIATTLEMF